MIEAPGTDTPNDKSAQGLAIHQLATEPPGPRGGYYLIFGSNGRVGCNGDLRAGQCLELYELTGSQAGVVVEDHPTGLQKRHLVEPGDRLTVYPSTRSKRPVGPRGRWVTSPCSAGFVEEVHPRSGVGRLLSGKLARIFGSAGEE